VKSMVLRVSFTLRVVPIMDLSTVSGPAKVSVELHKSRESTCPRRDPRHSEVPGGEMEVLLNEP
jgi:hypothetical protein